MDLKEGNDVEAQMTQTLYNNNNTPNPQANHQSHASHGSRASMPVVQYQNLNNSGSATANLVLAQVIPVSPSSTGAAAQAGLPKTNQIQNQNQNFGTPRGNGFELQVGMSPVGQGGHGIVGVAGVANAPLNADLNLNSGYYCPVEDRKDFDYDENMVPWDNGKENNFLFFAYSSRSVNAQIQSKSLQNVTASQQNSASVQSGTSVYHRVGSNRLIVKKREKESLLALSKKNPLAGIAIGSIILGILALLTGLLSSSTTTTLIGIVLFIIGVSMLCCCRKNQSQKLEAFVFTTQSIPLNSIHFVDRQVESFDAAKAINGCCGCCGTNSDVGIQYSEVTIGYNRSNVSYAFSWNATGNPNNTEDIVKVTLTCIQAYNLHQYLNCIMDGKNIMNYNTDLSRYVQFNHLPTK